MGSELIHESELVIAAASSGDTFSLLGVHITNVTCEQAIKRVSSLLSAPTRASTIYFANAHVLMQALEHDLRVELNSATYVFADGVGVRCGAIAKGERIKDNLNGTDFVPRFLDVNSARGYRCYLLGSSTSSVEAAAREAAQRFPGWSFVGHHNGYFDQVESAEVIARINDSMPDLLLVGMGTPVQERWLAVNRSRISASVCMGVGGLFDFWSHRRRRAPRLIRRMSLEWLFIMLTEKQKWRRYLLEGWSFLLSVWREAWRVRVAHLGDALSDVATPVFERTHALRKRHGHPPNSK